MTTALWTIMVILAYISGVLHGVKASRKAMILLLLAVVICAIALYQVTIGEHN